jgi:radical SAM superfamily enzyme YgiQ (UPF0313 family)
MCPDEALDHCDVVVQGEAESTWPRLLKDFENNMGKRSYRDNSKAELAEQTAPDLSKLTRTKYFADIIQTTKGCPFDCEFCSVTAFDGRSLRHKDVSR